MNFDAADVNVGSLSEPIGAWVYNDKRGWRRWLAWLLRRPLVDAYWIDMTNKSTESGVLHWNAAGIFWVDPATEKETPLK